MVQRKQYQHKMHCKEDCDLKGAVIVPQVCSKHAKPGTEVGGDIIIASLQARQHGIEHKAARCRGTQSTMLPVAMATAG